MTSRNRTGRLQLAKSGLVLTAALLCAGAFGTPAVTGSSPAPAKAAATKASSYIVTGPSLAAVSAAVRTAGGRITHELGVIDAVAAELTSAQEKVLRADSRLTLTINAGTSVAGYAGAPYVVRHTQAKLVHDMGITGQGVTIAFLDTGLWPNTPLAKNVAGATVFLQGYDAIANVVGTGKVNDSNGHGTNVVSIAANSATAVDGAYIGIAPNASRVAVRAFSPTGTGTYADAIRGLDWIFTNRATYNIRVLNLSFGTKAQSFYWNDPLARAVMKLWQAGVVVVASAGNSGPTAQTITVPGNIPYVITVGAMTDNYTPSNAADDRLASFSSTGPTYEGFVKPEIVAPGGHVTGIMNKTGTIPSAHPEFHDGDKYFMMSGTSQSAAVVSGIVALMLQASPSLTPDQVKCRLVSSAKPAVDSAGKLAYTVFQQGAGQVNAYAAVLSTAGNCANVGLNIAADLAGTAHYGGPARQNPDGSFYVVDANNQPLSGQGYLWNNGYLWNQGYLWNNGYLWNQGYLWSNGYLWNNSNLWNNGYLWNNSFVPATTSVSGINAWVNQE